MTPRWAQADDETSLPDTACGAQRDRRTGRPSIAPERLPGASSRLMEQIDYKLLFRWFVGLNPNERFPRNRPP